MTKNPWTNPRALERPLADQLLSSLRRFQRAGRTGRTVRRIGAIALLVGAAVLAVAPSATPEGTLPAIGAARDLPIGAVLNRADLVAIPVNTPPDGAIHSFDAAVGEALAAPVRRGEVLTDLRLVDDGGLQPGAGQVAVPITLPEPELAGLLRPGMAVTIIAARKDPFDSDRRGPAPLSVDAVVLAVVDADGGGLSGPARDRTVVLAVAESNADAVAAAAISDALTLRFR